MARLCRGRAQDRHVAAGGKPSPEQGPSMRCPQRAHGQQLPLLRAVCPVADGRGGEAALQPRAQLPVLCEVWLSGGPRGPASPRPALARAATAVRGGPTAAPYGPGKWPCVWEHVQPCGWAAHVWRSSHASPVLTVLSPPRHAPAPRQPGRRLSRPVRPALRWGRSGGRRPRPRASRSPLPRWLLSATCPHELPAGRPSGGAQGSTPTAVPSPACARLEGAPIWACLLPWAWHQGGASATDHPAAPDPTAAAGDPPAPELPGLSPTAAQLRWRLSHR